MRGSSPALAVITPRVRVVPRPTPRTPVPIAPKDRPTVTNVPNVPPDNDSSEPIDLVRRAMLRSVDLEVLYDGARAPAKSTIPPPLPSRRHRARLDTPPTSRPQLLDGVVADLEDLVWFETMVEAAAFCLVTAMKAVPCLAGMAVLRDEERGYVVVYARGPRSFDVVRMRVREDDPAIGAALVRGGPAVIEYGPERRPPVRYEAFGDPWTALVVPVQEPNRCIGSIELVDPTDSQGLGDSARETLATIARRLVEFGRGRTIRVGNVFAPEQVGLED